MQNCLECICSGSLSGQLACIILLSYNLQNLQFISGLLKTNPRCKNSTGVHGLRVHWWPTWPILFT